MPVAIAATTLAILLANSSRATDIEIVAGTQTNAEALTVLLDMFAPEGRYSESLLPDTARHVATSIGAGAKVDLYMFEAVFESRGIVSCWLTETGFEGGGGASAGCAEAASPATIVIGGSSGTGDRWVGTSGVVGAPPSATRILVHTAHGRALEAALINGASVVVWQGDSGDYPTSIFATDPSGTEVWSRDLAAPPPLPDISAASTAVAQTVAEPD